MSHPQTDIFNESLKEAQEEEEEIASNLEHYHLHLGLDQLAEKLRKVGRTATAVEECRKIIDEACNKNPRGLPF